jgi:hypothetical protein
LDGRISVEGSAGGPDWVRKVVLFLSSFLTSLCKVMSGYHLG